MILYLIKDNAVSPMHDRTASSIHVAKGVGNDLQVTATRDS